MDGVVRTTVGYAGGTTPHPTYQEIGDHTESIEIEFDLERVSYRDLLEEFWRGHDPTRVVYSMQYRSAIFYRGPEQQRAAILSRERSERACGCRIETALEAAGPFTRAEDYHQKYRLRADRVLFHEFREMLGDGREFADSTAVARVNGFLDGFGGPDALGRVEDRLGLSSDGARHLRAAVAAMSSPSPARTGPE